MKMSASLNRAVLTALEALRQGKPLSEAHPLLGFSCMNPGLEGEEVSQAVKENRVFWHLTRLISKQLARHRQLYERVLNPSDLPAQGEFKTLQLDFQHGNTELEAWSLLHYRYGRIDLGLSMAKIAQLTRLQRRTLQRRQHLGVHRLSHLLARREMKVLDQRRQNILLAQLPSPTASPLIGRQHLLEYGLSHLTNSAPAHLLLYGPPGIGKSALALEIARRLIQVLPVQRVSWLYDPDPALTWLFQDPGDQIALPPLAEKPDSDLLVILDNADAIVESPEAMRKIQRSLSLAKLIICAVRPPSHGQMFTCVRVPELETEQVLELIEHYLKHRYPKTHEDILDRRLYRYEEDLGGHPGALLKAIGMGQQYESAGIAHEFYTPVWESLSIEARDLWLTLAGIPAVLGESSLGLANPLSSRPDLQWELLNTSVLQVAGDLPPTLTALAKGFAKTITHSQAVYADSAPRERDQA